MSDIIIVGAGIFGLTAALELNQRGHTVTVCNATTIPDPLSATADISKVVRFDYGPDELYMRLGMAAIKGWHRWNTTLGEQVYYESGVNFLTTQPPEPGTFEFESRRLIEAAGYALLPIEPKAMPAWSAAYTHGYLNPKGGWARSGRTLELLTERARTTGITLHAGRPVTAVGQGGVTVADGTTLSADKVLVAAGAWTPHLLPDLAPHLIPTGHPVFHLQPADPSPFVPPRFTTFTADISTTGWYGFHYDQREGVIKIARHSTGRVIDPINGERRVLRAEEDALRAFLHDALPALATAPITYRRLCLYCDTPDGDFLISAHRESVFVATGGSGHGFKFAPVLGGIIADVVEGQPHPRFGWRSFQNGAESARHQ